jgi:hypothetical protein
MLRWLIACACLLGGCDAGAENRADGAVEDMSEPDGSSESYASDDPRLDGLRGPKQAEEPCRPHVTPRSSDATREAARVAVSGDHIFALSPFGLTSIDATSAEAPRVLDRDLSIVAPIEVVLLSDDVALVISETADDCSQPRVTLTTFDISEPAAIEPLERQDIEGSYAGLRRAGDTLHVMAREDNSIPYWVAVTAFDVTNPGTPVRGDSLALRSESDEQERPVLVAASERLYVSSHTSEDSTEIRVVPLDPSGVLSVASTFEVEGGIYWSWQLNEHEGTVRVLSHGEEWPAVTTFAVDQDHQVSLLGRLEMLLEVRELLFDGPRAYVQYQNGAEGPDDYGWLAIDLQDPTTPHLEQRLELGVRLPTLFPRGDRLLAAFYDLDDEDANSQFSVALFDVRDLAAPLQLDSTQIEGDLNGSLVFDEDADMFAVPSRTTESIGDDGECWHPAVQLVAFDGDALAVRGVTPLTVVSERLRLLDDRMISTSYDGVELFDISDPDAPIRTGDLSLARNTKRSARVGEHLVVAGTGHGNGSLFLDVHELEPALSSVPIASVEWAPVDCIEWWREVDDLQVDGSRVHVLHGGRRDAGYGNVHRVTTIDVSDPMNPRITGEGVIHDDVSGNFDVDEPSVLTSQPFQHGFVQLTFASSYAVENGVPKTTLRVLQAPSGAAVVGELVLGDSAEAPILQVRGDQVYVGRLLADEATERADFQVDRIDLDEPAAPTIAGTYGVPGRLLSVLDNDRLLTVSYRRTRSTAPDEGSCFEVGGYVPEESKSGDVTCVVLEETLHLGRFERDRYALEDSYALGAGVHAIEASLVAQRIFVRTSRWRDESPAAGEIIVLYGFEAGRLDAVHVPIDNASGHSTTLGERFAFVDRTRTAVVLDASDPEHIEVSERPAVCPGYAWICQPSDSGFVAAGHAGLAALE